VGTFKAAASLESCSACPDARQTTSSAGASSSSECACRSPFVWSSSLSSCVCAAGAGFDAALDTCVSCSVGAFKPRARRRRRNASLEACSSCPSLTSTGGTGAASSSECVCAGGLVADAASGGSCVCPPGAGFSSSSSSCVSCAAGSFKAGFDLLACSPCPMLYATTSGTGSVSVSNCSCVNDLVLAGGSCVCAAGQVFDAATQSCGPCPAGSFKASASLSSCESCPAHTTTSGTGSASASSCVCDSSRGFVSDGGGNGSCVCPAGAGFDAASGVCSACGVGTFKAAASLESCSACPDARQTTSSAGASSSSECACRSPFVWSSSLSSCVCAAGAGFDAALDTCVSCSVGAFKPNASLEACSSCPSLTSTGGTGAASSSECVCAGGLVADAASGGSCVCPPGAGFSSSSSSCVSCAAGSFKAGFDLLACSPCPMLYATTNGTGSVSVSNCSCVNDLVLAGGSCVCAAGQVFDAATQSCGPCPAGSFKASASLSSCESCPAHTTTSGTGSASASSCVCDSSRGFVSDGGGNGSCVCPAGQQLDAATSVCLPCGVGTFKAAASLESCSACPVALTTTLGTGASSSSECVCPSGFTLAGDSCLCAAGFGLAGSSCQACADGTFAASASSSPCSLCSSLDPHAVSSPASAPAGATSCECGAGFFATATDAAATANTSSSSNSSSSLQCAACVAGMECSGAGASLEGVAVQAGFWRSSASSTRVRSCPSAQACAAGNATGDAGCREGHEGALCAVCSSGWTAASPQEACASCSSGGGPSTWLLASVLGVVVVVWLLSRLGGKPGASAAKLVALADKPGVRVQLKVLLVYFQIVASFQSSFASDAPASYRGFAGALQLLSLRLSSLLSLDCWSSGGFSFFDELLARTLLPVLVGVALVLAYLPPLWRARSDAGERARTAQALLSWVVLSCFFFFPSASTAVLQTFDRDDDFDGGDCWLKADYSLSCRADDATYGWFRAYATLMVLVFPVGIPVFFFLLTWLHKRDIRESADEALAARSSSSPTLAMRAADDALDARVVQLRLPENRVAASRLSREVQRRSVIEAARRKPELYGVVSLFEAYRPELWWWECVECVRRLLLSAVLALAWPGTARQVAAAMLVCMAFLLGYTWARPYLSPAHNTFVSAAQWALLLQLFGCLLARDASVSFGGSDAALGACMVAVGVLLPLLPLARSHEAAHMWQAVQAERASTHGRMSLTAAVRKVVLDHVGEEEEGGDDAKGVEMGGVMQENPMAARRHASGRDG
jgi:hypothetical protein